MDTHHRRNALLKISLVLLGLTSWFSLSSILGTRPANKNTALESAPNKLAQLARLPASLPTPLAVEASASAAVRMDLVKINCWDQGPREWRAEGARWIRLLGNACKHAPGAKRISVTNVTNGYAATVFDLSTGGLTTDYIPLMVGSNAVVIHIDYEDGRRSLDTRLNLTR